MAARVLVLNCFIKGWNILKRLADDGFIVNGADYRPNAPGLFSNRIADKTKNFIYPDPKNDEAAFTQAVIDYISQQKFDLILPVNAAEMMALARRRDDLARHTRFPFENYHKLLLLHDKKYFFELMTGHAGAQLLPRSWSIGDRTQPISEIMEKAGVPGVPFVPMVDYDSVDGFLASTPVYPLVVKTRRATSAVGVYRVNDDNALRQACNRLGGSDIIVQELANGRGVGLSSLRWRQPDLLCHFGHKRVREYPISGGASTSREPWDTDQHPLPEIITSFLDKLDWHGVVMFELKERQPSGDVEPYRFLEANPRFWGSVPLAMANGVNFPALLCRAATGMNIPPIVKGNKRRARIFFSDTLSCLLNVLHGRRVGYHLRDYVDFRNLYLDDIDFGDWPATRRIFGMMLREFIARRKAPGQ